MSGRWHDLHPPMGGARELSEELTEKESRTEGGSFHSVSPELAVEARFTYRSGSREVHLTGNNAAGRSVSEHPTKALEITHGSATATQARLAELAQREAVRRAVDEYRVRTNAAQKVLIQTIDAEAEALACSVQASAPPAATVQPPSDCVGVPGGTFVDGLVRAGVLKETGHGNMEIATLLELLAEVIGKRRGGGTTEAGEERLAPRKDEDDVRYEQKIAMLRAEIAAIQKGVKDVIGIHLAGNTVADALIATQRDKDSVSAAVQNKLIPALIEALTPTLPPLYKHEH